MSPVFNPTRRNRNIGTTKSGHGQNNTLKIPEVFSSERGWSETLKTHLTIHRTVKEVELIFFVESLNLGFEHACTVDDICNVLKHLPKSDWQDVKAYVLRQPTKKQRTLNPVWARMFYYAELGLMNRKNAYEGPAILFEAFKINETITWPASLGPSDLSEIESLKSDGHEIVREGRKYKFILKRETVRCTQLYRSLLHELGHWVDYLTKVEIPSDKEGGDFSTLREAYFKRPRNEREAYADAYASKMQSMLRETKLIPFEPVLQPPPLYRP